jgi:hypothetical protein
MTGGQLDLQHLLRGDVGMSTRIKTMPQTMTTMVTSSGENTSIAVALLHTRCEMESYYSLLLSLTAGIQKITVTPIWRKFEVRVESVYECNHDNF